MTSCYRARMQYPLLVVALAACASTSTPPRSPAYPLLDSRCDEYQALAHERHTIAPGMELFAFQDRDYVWLCYTTAAPNHAPMDMVVSAPALAEPLDIHVSAQLGEWPANREDLVPKDGASELWWNHQGWGALTIPFNGLTADGKVNWRQMPGREMQIAKARFGRGSWKLRFKIYNVRFGEAEPTTIEFPKTGELELKVW